MKPIFSKYRFDLYTENQLETWLSKCGMSLSSPKAIADAIMALSDVYNGSKGSTEIWNKNSYVAAYLAYFMPLNYLRCRYVLNQTSIRSPKVVDFGAGIGAFTFAVLKDGADKNRDWPQITAVEPSGTARKWLEVLLRDLNIPQTKVSVVNQLSPSPLLNDSALLFSYSLNEMGELPGFASKSQELLIVEPSLRDVARRLQALRPELQNAGFHMEAPCLHQLACPLLVHSKTDWCHTRLHVEMPDWFKKIENLLPIKNQTLTLSYLSAHKSNVALRTADEFRIIGDTLFEKGKTRQAVCRNDRREYLSWLKRDGEAPVIERGSHIRVSSPIVEVSNEIRSDGPFAFEVLK